MIKIENVVVPSTEEMMFVIQGMRNPMNSWDKSDSKARIGDNMLDICGNSTPVPAGFSDDSGRKDGFWTGGQLLMTKVTSLYHKPWRQPAGN